MKTKSQIHLFKKLANKNALFPIGGLIELTYRCNLNCLHCYCKGLDDAKDKNSKDIELTTDEVKKILDDIQREGCFHLGLSGGEALIREDFLEIYSYAKQKGFLITLLTNGQALTQGVVDFLAKYPPRSIEITLNGSTENTYETITQVKGSYAKVMKAIELIKKRNLPLLLKTNCLKQNKHEVVKVKAFAEKFLGRPAKNKYFFKYDSSIEPRLNGDRSVCDFRVSFEELMELKKQDKEIWKEFQGSLHCNFPALPRDKDYLYHCNSWTEGFFINPFGRLKFCEFSEKFSADLRKIPFREGFYEVFPKLWEEKFKTDSKCRTCSLRPVCSWCPAKAYLETGNEEAPVEYYCQMAEKTAKLWQLYQESAIAGQPLSPTKR